MYRIVFMRHGRSLADDERVHEGRYDSPLTDVGRQQALTTAGKFRSLDYDFDRITASPLARAFSTAEIIGRVFSREIILQPLWMERDNGLLAGKPFGRETDSAFPVPEKGWGLYDRRANGSGESAAQLYARAVLAVEDLLNYPQGSYLVVAHGGILNAAIRYIMGSGPASDWEGGVGFCFHDNGFMEFEYRRELNRWDLIRFDGGYDTSGMLGD